MTRKECDGNASDCGKGFKSMEKGSVPFVSFTWFGVKWIAKAQRLPSSKDTWWAGTTVWKDCTIIIDSHCVGDTQKMVRFLRHELTHVAIRYSSFSNGTEQRKITDEDVAAFVEAWGGEISSLAEDLAKRFSEGGIK